jgi:phage portal protein BeeE
VRLLDRILGVQSERYVPTSSESVFVQAFGQPDNEKILPTYQNAVEAYGNSAVVFGVVLARLSLFTEAEFKFQALDDRHLFGGPSLSVLENPWPNGSTGELLARMEQDASMAGNAFIRNAGSQLERLRPDWTSIVSILEHDPATDTEVRRVVAYWYDPCGENDREAAYYPVDEVAHWSPIPDPLANFRGMSWLTPVLREIDGDQLMTDYKRAYLTNAATPNLLIKYPERANQASMDRLTAQVQARHGGVSNAFKTMVLDEGADVTVLGSKLKDMAFDVVQAAGETRIAAAGGVPPIVVGLSEGLQAATYSNYGMAMRRFADLTMRPNWRSACAALAKLVVVPDRARLWYDTSQIAALQEGEKERADTMAVLAAAYSAFIAAGASPESVKSVLAASDITQIDHTGLVSVQLQAPGSEPTTAPTQGGDA